MSDTCLDVTQTFEGVGRLRLGDATKNLPRLVVFQSGIGWLGSGQLMLPLLAACIAGFNSWLRKAVLRGGSLLSP